MPHALGSTQESYAVYGAICTSRPRLAVAIFSVMGSTETPCLIKTRQVKHIYGLFAGFNMTRLRITNSAQAYRHSLFLSMTYRQTSKASQETNVSISGKYMGDARSCDQ